MDIQQQRDPSLTHTKDQLTTTIGKLFEAIQIIIRKSLKITDSADVFPIFSHLKSCRN